MIREMCAASIAVVLLFVSEMSAASDNRNFSKSTNAETEGNTAAFDKVIAPYVAQARASYPNARARFQNGLPVGHQFFVTTRLRDQRGRVEQVFVLVTLVEGLQIRGTIASDIRHVEGYSRTQPYSFSDTELLDWVITRPDGSEEGNFVGKFLDSQSR